MPKVCPCEGWRMQVKTFFPKQAPNAWLSPTVVVVLPSPKGVGVMAVTSIYLPFGRSFRRSRISNLTLALLSPYSSSSDRRIPTSSATSIIGLISAVCAISMSDGTGRTSFNLDGVKVFGICTPGSDDEGLTLKKGLKHIA